MELKPDAVEFRKLARPDVFLYMSKSLVQLAATTGESTCRNLPYRVKILDVTCYDAQEIGTDEVVLWLEGSCDTKSASQDMQKGHKWQVNLEVKFAAEAKIEIWEKDWPDDDDQLGTHFVNPSDAELDQPRSVTFGGGGATYGVRYEVRKN